MKNKAKDLIEQYVERFDYHINDYKSGNYNESQARTDFINPFFEALGWDINNKAGLAESYREVIYEDKIKVAGSTKAPDYCFTVYGQKKFFVEAKKPKVNIKDQIEPAYQLRRYGWSAKLPISLITDFEEFAVYDCLNRPNPTDKASVGRIKYINYKDYIKEFDFLWDVFSKEQVLKGSFDRFVSSSKGKKGTAGVDAEFLKSLDTWRDLIARNIVNRNANITEDELNFATQKLIDRLIFLRICEDRGVELENQLMGCVGKDSFQSLKQIFHLADQKYNSGLFDYKKDKITDTLSIDDKVLKEIIEDMYYPKSPYEFSVIPVEIMGHSYEQYLGKVMRITPGHRIKIEEKPEVRKAGGVHYTPEFIVSYIVENTIGKLIEGKTPEEVAKMKFCDPSCGSGSFLLGAYQYLLNWHKNYYSEAKIKNKDKYITPEGNLTTSVKKQILLNNIFGVDIDTNAVEITKLSLMLKAMEGETTASINQQLSLMHDKVLPTLDDNIKSGNSLIDLDFYENELDFEPGMEKKIKPFNWQSAFPQVFKQGGFDAIIGNPPYIRIQTMTEYLPPSVINYYKTRFYSGQAGNIDIYVVFIEKAYNLLNKNGLLGFIQPHKFFPSQFGENLREFITQRKAIYEIVHFGSNKVFDQADTYTCLLFLSSKENLEFQMIEILAQANLPELFTNGIKNFNISSKIGTIKHPEKSKDKWSFMSGKSGELIDKLKTFKAPKLSDFAEKIFVGLQTSADNIYVLKTIQNDFDLNTSDDLIELFSKQLNRNVIIEKGLLKPFLMGRDVYRYSDPLFRNFVIFPYLIDNGKATLMSADYIISHFPNGWQYIIENKKALEEREKGKMKHQNFYAYIYPKNLAYFNQNKIQIRELGDKPNMFFDLNDFYHTAKIYSLILKNQSKKHYKTFLGILNSKLLNFFIKNTSEIWGTSHKFKTQFLNPFPIVFPSPEAQSQLVKLVETMLQLNKDLQAATLPEQKEQLQARISYTDKKIDQLVYQLYELTEEEIKIVEGE